MRRVSLVVWIAATLAALGHACGSSDGAGSASAAVGAGGAAGSGATGSGGIAPSSSTGFDSCVGAFYEALMFEQLKDHPCIVCVETSCCPEILAWGGTPPDALPEDLAACASENCLDSCLVSPLPPPICNAPMPPPSAGTCITVGGPVACNPVSNLPCDTAGGEVCANIGVGFACLTPPVLPSACADCVPWAPEMCGAGDTCIFEQCYKLCCGDVDCAAGKCLTELEGQPLFPFAPSMGVCVEKGAGGAGGGGGAGGAGGAAGSGG